MRDFVIMRKILSKEHPKRPEEYIPGSSTQGDHLWSLLTKCWEYNPPDRPTAAEVQDKVGTNIHQPLFLLTVCPDGGSYVSRIGGGRNSVRRSRVWGCVGVVLCQSLCVCVLK
jgi:hypothetical protein